MLARSGGSQFPIARALQKRSKTIANTMTREERPRRSRRLFGGTIIFYIVVAHGYRYLNPFCTHLYPLGNLSRSHFRLVLRQRLRVSLSTDVAIHDRVKKNSSYSGEQQAADDSTAERSILFTLFATPATSGTYR